MCTHRRWLKISLRVFVFASLKCRVVTYIWGCKASVQDGSQSFLNPPIGSHMRAPSIPQKHHSFKHYLFNLNTHYEVFE